MRPSRRQHSTAALRVSAALVISSVAFAVYVMACTVPPLAECLDLGCDNVSIQISPATLPNGTAGAAYSQQLSVSGGTAPYIWSISSGSLPPGLTLDAGTTPTATAGLIHGTPTTPSATPYSFLVAVVDNASGFNTMSYTITIGS